MLLTVGTFLIATLVMFVDQTVRNWLSFFASAFCGLLAAVVVFALSTVIIGGTLPSEYKLDSTVKLTTIRSTDANLDGQYLIGASQNLNAVKYLYYSLDEDGGIRTNSLSTNAKETVVYEVADLESAELRIYKRTLYFPWNILVYAMSDYHYEFSVPEGSAFLAVESK